MSTDAYEIIKNHNSNGCNVPLYLNKSQYGLTKDRMAVALISEGILMGMKDFNHTIIRAIDGISGLNIMYKSNIVLTYESLIAFVYNLRLRGLVISGIYNICMSDRYMISVEDIHTEVDTVKVYVGDRERYLVPTLMLSNSYRNKEKHVVKVVNININESCKYTQYIIDKVLKKSCRGREEFRVISNFGEEYYIYEYSEFVAIINGKSILFFSNNGKIDIRKFIMYLKKVFDYEGKDVNVEVSKSIVFI